MTREEIENGTDDMLIDGSDEQRQDVNAVRHEVNANYLKSHYGNDDGNPGCDESYFGRREFSFTLENDVYLCFRSYNSASELEKYIKDSLPFRIDIGAVYSVDPSKRFAYAQSGDNAFTPVERELVFDIDISDYDDVRYCCSGADVCLECWPLMTIAIKVIDTSLRGCLMSRGAISDYFRVYRGSENSNKKVSLPGPALHPFLTTSYTNVLKPFFEEKLICSQNLRSTEERYEKILEMIPDESVASELRGKWQDKKRPPNSKEDINNHRWGQLKNLLQSGKRKVCYDFINNTVSIKPDKATGLRRCIEEIVFAYTYPRLDMEDSKHMIHLLKAPFCVHPKTGRVCVPIDPNRCEEFDPTTVPTLSRLLEELNSGASQMQIDSENKSDTTSLGKSIKPFKSSFLHPLLKSCKKEMESSYNAKIQQSRNSIGW